MSNTVPCYTTTFSTSLHGYLGCFPFLIIRNNASIIISQQMCLWYNNLNAIPLNISPEVALLLWKQQCQPPSLMLSAAELTFSVMFLPRTKASHPGKYSTVVVELISHLNHVTCPLKPSRVFLQNTVKLSTRRFFVLTDGANPAHRRVPGRSYVLEDYGRTTRINEKRSNWSGQTKISILYSWVLLKRCRKRLSRPFLMVTKFSNGVRTLPNLHW